VTMTTPAAWIEVSQDVGALILRLCGELDAHGRALIEPAVTAAIPTAYEVVLDLRDLTFCDSGGVAMFVAEQHEAEAAGTTLSIRNVPPPIARLFEITGVDRTLNIRR
jgi:anti-sigma B factor antagonist